MTLPNLITIGRLVIVPLVIVMIGQGEWLWAFGLFLAAGISDGVDGYIARRWDMRSELGAYIDPLADKALLVSIYVALAVEHVLPSWLAVLVVSRDVIILAAIAVSRLMDRPMAISPLAISKINTAAQIAFAALVLAAKAWDGDGALGSAAWIGPGAAAVALLTVASGATYLARWLKHMAVEGPAS